jgi:heterodisulfide reductase subunit A-like polyferredoxin
MIFPNAEGNPLAQIPAAPAAVIIGGGIAGIQAALDIAEAGFKVHLVERLSSIGGRMAQLDKTFPTLDCSSCILTPKMADVTRNPNITLHTCTEVTNVSGQAGAFHVTLEKQPRYVDVNSCTGCGLCAEVCPVEITNSFNAGLGSLVGKNTVKAIYRRFPQAVPAAFVIEKHPGARLHRFDRARPKQEGGRTDPRGGNSLRGNPGESLLPPLRDDLQTLRLG